MRALLGLIAIALLLAICGWITFSWNGNRASVNVETEKIESDTERIVDEGQEVLDAVSREVSDGDTSPEPEADELDDAPAGTAAPAPEAP